MAEDGDRLHRALHLLLDTRKDCRGSDSMGALSKSVIFISLKMLFSCSVVCPSASVSVTPKPAKKTLCLLFLCILSLCLHSSCGSFSLEDVEPSPFLILLPIHCLHSFLLAPFFTTLCRVDPYLDTGMQITLWIRGSINGRSTLKEDGLGSFACHGPYRP